MEQLGFGASDGVRRRAAWGAGVAVFALSVLGVGGCWQVAGVSLGLFFGAAGMATVVVPSLVAGAPAGWAGRVLVPAATTIGAAGLWMLTPAQALTWGQWLACSGVLLSYSLALGAVSYAAVSLRAAPVVAAASVTIAGLLWLTWPVWLSHALLTHAGDTLVGWLVPAHPLFALNGVLVHFDSWDRLPLAYARLSNLNQDISYALPRSVVPTMLLHLLVAGICGSLAALIGRWRDPAAKPGPTPGNGAP